MVVDRQSTNLIEGGTGLFYFYQPLGESFSPTYSAINFVNLNLYDGDPLNVSNAFVVVNLRSNSVTGSILSSTMPVLIPDEFFGAATFFFSNTVPLLPGTTYFLQPEIQSGSLGVGSYVTDTSYIGGVYYQSGNVLTDRNLWFQEGIILVPEPTAISLLSLSGAFFLLRHRFNIQFRP